MFSLTAFGLSKSRFTWLMMTLVMFMGISSYMSLPKREDPAVSIRTAVVIIKNPGMSPTRMEELIAVPAERKIREIGEVEDVRSINSSGEALIYIDLYDHISPTGIEDAWEDLRNKMQSMSSDLPAGSIGPIVNTDYGDVSIATIAVTGDGFSNAEIEDYAEELQRKLYTVDGVTKVSLFGEQDERIWLELDSRRLASVGVQMEQLLDDLGKQNIILPAGSIDADGTRVTLEVNGDLTSVDEISNVLTKVDGLDGYVSMSDLVKIRRGYVDPAVEPVFYNGQKAIIAAVEMSSQSDVQVLGKTLLKKIEQIQTEMPIGISLNISTFQEVNVTESVTNALVNVAQTFIVVFIIMLLFQGMRAALATASIVPFTICIALAVMAPLGVDIQKVSIAAIIISLGLLVDNGLVMVEDILERRKAGAKLEEAALATGSQFMVPLGIASLTTVSAFLPMLMLDGTEGDFAYSMGAVVAAMLAGSWLSAQYFLPFLTTKLLKSNSDEGEKKPSWMEQKYAVWVRNSLPFSLIVVLLMYGMVVFSGMNFGLLKSEQFPMSERADFLIYMDMPKGTAISETTQTAINVSHWLNDKEQNPGIKDVTAYIGSGGPRFNLGLNPADPDPASAFFQVNTTDLASAVDAVKRSRRLFIERFPEARFRVTQLAQGGSEAGIVEVEISGPDNDTLLQAAKKVEEAFNQLPNVTINENDWGNKVAKIVVDIAQDKAREYGTNSENIAKVLNGYFSGTSYSVFREDDKQIPIALRSLQDKRDSIGDLANLSIPVGNKIISLDQVATISPKMEYSKIRRKNQVRQITISGKSLDHSAGETLELIQPALDELNLGPDYNVNIAGEIEDAADVNGKLVGQFPLALGVMFAALIFQFNSIRRALATFATIPLIVVGAPWVLWLTGQPQSFFANLGMMSLMGIIINNAIVMIDQIDIENETMEIKDAIVTAAQKRMRPILLTSLTTILGLVPLAYSGGLLFEPMAAIMIGGLLMASPLTLFFVPAICYLLLAPKSFFKPKDKVTPETTEAA